MPEKDEIKSALEDLKAISDQKSTVIKEFSDKYKKLDADVKALEIKKKELEKSALSVASANEEALVIVKKANSQSTEIINAAKADAKDIVEKAIFEAGNIIAEAVAKKEAAEKAEKAVADKIGDANDKEATSARLLRESATIKAEAEKHLAEARTASLEASKRLAEASRMIVEAETQRDAVNLASQGVKDGLSLLRDKESAVEIDRMAVSDARAKLNDDIASFNALVSTKTAEINEKLAEIEATRIKMAKQKEENAFKVAELDAGFMKLKREQADLKKQQVIIDNMKKELSNRGA